jgi:hypothetical protein
MIDISELAVKPKMNIDHRHPAETIQLAKDIHLLAMALVSTA